ncbi:MAG TPA: hypothetical protein VM489_06240 [Burkholderiales bacterium]|nr:hypothetical protein [Burkholderiales bacterium]
MQRPRRHQLGGPASLALLVVLLSACTIVGHEKVPGWPTLEIVEHYVPHAVMRTRCDRYVAFGMQPLACAEFDLANRRCHVWYSADFPPTRDIIEHERLHCRGYDHVGMKTMAGILERHLAATESAAAGR